MAEPVFFAETAPNEILVFAGFFEDVSSRLIPGRNFPFMYRIFRLGIDIFFTNIWI